MANEKLNLWLWQQLGRNSAKSKTVHTELLGISKFDRMQMFQNIAIGKQNILRFYECHIVANVNRNKKKCWFDSKQMIVNPFPNDKF